MATCLFWACALALFYVYVLYPGLARTLAACFRVPLARGGRLPRVTVVVTVYNEERSIRSKLDNLSSLDYPAELLEVLVVSDASSDSTERIAAGYDRRTVRILRIEGRVGKTACQNAAADNAAGEVLVFTDATTELRSDALRELVAPLCDSRIGCVAGRLAYASETGNLTGRGGETYWSYELQLRRAESALGSLVGVSGCLYAVRKSAYRPIEPQLISDFVISMKMREQGLRTVLAPAAVCAETTLDDARLELSMRVRVAIRSLNALVHERRFLNPLVYGVFAWQLWSHKLLRYASPLFWIATFASNVLLVMRKPWSPYSLLLAGQCAILTAGTAGFVIRDRVKNFGLLGKPYYFLLTNLASLLAMLRYIRGERMVTWNPVRHGDVNAAPTSSADWTDSK